MVNKNPTTMTTQITSKPLLTFGNHIGDIGVVKFGIT